VAILKKTAVAEEKKMVNAQEPHPGIQSESQGASPYVPPTSGPQMPAWRRGFVQEDPRSKSPVLAALLSLMPGLGQIYLGYYIQGFTNIVVIASLITLLARGLGDLTPLAALFMAFYWLYNIVDASRRASFYNQALAGLGPMELPADIEMPGGKGSLFGGVALIVLGGLALAYTRFNVSMVWLERWWPAALVILGGYLIYRSFAAKTKKS
jgi:TM2 domain-containing membrane protein YozV